MASRMSQALAFFLVPFLFVAGLPIIVVIYQLLTSIDPGNNLVVFFVQFLVLCLFGALVWQCYKFVETGAWGFLEF